MSLSEVLQLPRLILKGCLCYIYLNFLGPFTSTAPYEWLAFFNKVENKLRSGVIPGAEKDLVTLYDYAIEVSSFSKSTF